MPGGGVAVAQRRVEPLHVGVLERTAPGAVELDRGAQVDDRAHPELGEQIDVARHQVVERVAAEHHAGAGRAAVVRRQPTEVAEVEGPVERDEAVLVCRHRLTVRNRR